MPRDPQHEPDFVHGEDDPRIARRLDALLEPNDDESDRACDTYERWLDSQWGD
jgi:hypothetical protein